MTSHMSGIRWIPPIRITNQDKKEKESRREHGKQGNRNYWDDRTDVKKIFRQNIL